MSTVCSYIFQVFWTVVGTGNFNSFWVCNFNKWKKITRRTPQSAKASHVAHSSEQERRECAGERQPRRGLTWFPSLYFQPCWRTPKKVAHMRCAEVSQQGPRGQQSPAAPLPHPSHWEEASQFCGHQWGLQSTREARAAGVAGQHLACHNSSEAPCIHILKYTGFPQERRRKGESIVFL